MLQRIRNEFEKVSDRQMYAVGFLIALVVATVSWTAIKTFDGGTGYSPEYIFSGTPSILGLIASSITLGMTAITAFRTGHSVSNLVLLVVAAASLGLGLLCLKDLIEGRFFLIGTLSIAGSSVLMGLLVPIILKKDEA